MSRTRLLLLPFAATVELVMLFAALAASPVSLRAALRIAAWADRLPAIEWYLGERT